MTTTHAFRQALHIPWGDPDLNEIVAAIVPGAEYSTDWLNAAGTPEAPTDGKQYGRQSVGWTEITWASVSGKPSIFPPMPHTHPYNTLTGIPLTFPPSPHGHLQAEVSNLETDLAARVLKAGDTMTGHLGLPADPVSDMQAATKRYVDAASGGSISDVPLDGVSYVRKDRAWAALNIDCGTY